MSTIGVAQVATAASATSPAATPVEPGAAQVARFEQQLQAPSQFYQAPSAATAGWSGNWAAVVDDVARVDQEYRVDSAALETTPGRVSGLGGAPGENDPQRAEEVFAREMSQVTKMSNAMMNISLVTSAERLAGENVRSLYQVS